MIQIDNLTFTYGKQVPIFENFAWGADRKEAWAVIGPSGCGKTTLLYLLAGLRQPTAGTVRIAGETITRPRPRTGLILQDHGLLPWATVERNTLLGLDIRKFYGPDGRHAPPDSTLDKDERRRRMDHWLARLNIDELAAKYPGQLSGGQRQRVAIARTLVMQPDLLLMDEPFSALDAYIREDLQNLMLELHREAGLTSIIVTHNIEEAALLGRKILVLRHPPNREPHIINNPGAGDAAYRDHPDYRACCAELRSVMGIRAVNGSRQGVPA